MKFFVLSLFLCVAGTKGISVSSTSTSVPVTVLPSEAGPPGAFRESNNAHPMAHASISWWLTILAIVLITQGWIYFFSCIDHFLIHDNGLVGL